LVYYCRGRTYNEENLFEERALMKWRECGGSCMKTSKRLRSVGHVARMGEMRNAYRLLVKYKGKAIPVTGRGGL
jgi:hypothetical protein